MAARIRARASKYAEVGALKAARKKARRGRKCSVKGCGRVQHTDGLCLAHFKGRAAPPRPARQRGQEASRTTLSKAARAVRAELREYRKGIARTAAQGKSCPRCGPGNVMVRYRQAPGWRPKPGQLQWFGYWDRCARCGRTWNYEEAKRYATPLGLAEGQLSEPFARTELWYVEDDSPAWD
jgi:hypothetical protein